MAPVATLAVAVALLLDLAISEPAESVHPVAWFGRLIGFLDRPYKQPRAAGFALAALLPILGAVLAAVPVAVLFRIEPMLGGIAAGIVLFMTVSLRMLVTVGATVVAASERDLDAARETAIGLVGRDTERLSPGEIRSAAVESVAENLADGLLAPLLAFTIGSAVSLPVAAGAAAWVKGVNTLDSMVGYPEKPVGTASAKLDDLVEWLPARLSAVVIALAARDLRALGRARQWARNPASPNSGWPMATLAAVADMQLRKPGGYTLNPEAALPTVETATRAIRTVGFAGLLAFAFAGVGTWW